MTANNVWHCGWYRPAHRVESPNFGARPAQALIDLVVLHCISLPPGQYGGDQVMQFFTNQLNWRAHPYFREINGLAVSCHFFVARNGHLTQFVSCDARAWHAGISHYRGRDNCNDDSIGIELEGLVGDNFAAAQYDTLTQLCRAIMQRYPIAHIAGHEHIAPQRKFDPGVGFDWQIFKKNLALSERYFPTPTGAMLTHNIS